MKLFRLCALFLLAVSPCAATIPSLIGNSFTNSIDKAAKDYYYVNDIYSSFKEKIVVGEKELDVQSFYVTKPSGINISLPSIVLDEPGQYSISYFALDEGREVCVKENLMVRQTICSLSSDQSSLKWLDRIYQGQNKLPGYEISLAEGDSFTYNDVVDIKDSSISTPLIRFYPYSYSLEAGCSELEATRSIVRLTDYADPSNYIEVDINRFENRPGETYPYAVAGGSGQALSGIQSISETAQAGGSSRRIVYIDDVRYRVYYGGNDFGTQMGGSPGTLLDPLDPEGPKVHNADYNGYSIYYEASTKRIFIEDDSMRFITDLDESLIYDSNTFKGFKSDKVLVSLRAGNYSKMKARFAIDCIGGKYGNDIFKAYVEDDDAPEISFVGKFADDFLVSTNEEFEVFKAESYDLHPNNEGVKAEVFYEYGTKMQSNVTLVDGKFTPKKEGRYSIVYTAKDVYGNKSSKTVYLNAVKTENNVTVDFRTLKTSNVYAGATLKLNDYYISSINKNPFVTIKAIYIKTGEETIIDPTTLEFTPMHVGRYLISFTYGDEVIEKEYNYYLDASVSSNYVLGEACLPPYFIKGSVLTLEIPSIQIFTSEEDSFILPEVEASFDGGPFDSVDPDKLEIEGESNVAFRFLHNGVTLLTTEEYQIIDVGFDVKNGLRMQDYFVGNVIKEATDNDIVITTMQNGTATGFTFINPLSFANFNVGFFFNETESSFDYFKIIITDYYDESNFAELSFTKNGANYYLMINGGTSYLIKNQPTSTTNYIYYNQSGSEFLDSAGNSFSFASSFPNDKVMVSFEIMDSESNSSVHLTKIGNQNLSNLGKDSVAPQILVEDIGGEYSLKDHVTISKANVCDVLSPYLEENFSMTVSNSTGFVKADDGTLLDGSQGNKQSFDLTLSDFDEYIVRYSYVDNNIQAKPKESNIIMSLVVSEKTPPVITLDGGYGPSNIDNASVGQTVNVKGFKVSDNLTESSDIIVRIVVFTPDLKSLDVTETKSFVVSIEGTYKVYYYARDNKGNVATTYYQVRA